MSIHYAAANDTMGETPTAMCIDFRAWAHAQFCQDWPGYRITVRDAPTLTPTTTDDDAHREAIEAYGARLWDRCPWEGLP